MNYQWIYLLLALLQFGFLIGALIYLLVKRSERPAAARLAIIGVVLLLLLQLVGSALPALIASTVGTDSFILFNGLVQVGISIVRMLAYAMILAAIFVRPDGDNGDRTESVGPPTNSKNPYVSPMRQ